MFRGLMFILAQSEKVAFQAHFFWVVNFMSIKNRLQYSCPFPPVFSGCMMMASILVLILGKSVFIFSCLTRDLSILLIFFQRTSLLFHWFSSAVSLLPISLFNALIFMISFLWLYCVKSSFFNIYICLLRGVYLWIGTIIHQHSLNCFKYMFLAV